jgi:hypothetical protein
VCGKPDWCLTSADGTAAICPRIESLKRAGEAGWLHRPSDQRPASRMVRHVRLAGAPGTGADLDRQAAEYRAALDAGRRDQFARQLGLSAASLASLGVGWSETHDAYSFPMLDPGGVVVGIRLRRPDGAKYAVRGGRDGLFLPAGPGPGQTVFASRACAHAREGTAGPDAPGGRLLVCEGPTDAAALLDLGFRHVAGRPSCTGGVRLLCELVRRRRPDEVVVVADADEPGRRGADSLASVLVRYSAALRVVAPPGGVKDVRDFLRAGGTKADLEAVIGVAPVRRLWVVGRAGR